MYQNFPNPFNPSTTIKYQLPINSYVSLVVYNIKGEKVRTLVEKEKSAGFHSVLWDGRDEDGNEVANGVYYYKVRLKREGRKDIVEIGKMMKLK